jgi:hypothetical protein
MAPLRAVLFASAHLMQSVRAETLFGSKMKHAPSNNIL